jgi:hypothetical protein
MGVEITPYTASCIDGVRQFNQRLALGGEGEYQLPPDLRQFDDSAAGPIPWEGWLAVDDGVVRGGYLLRWQEFSFRGEIRKVAFYNLSVSEGAIDPAYAGVSMRMITNAVSRAPLMFALGMGGVEKRLPRFLRGFGWKLYEIPFQFRAVNPGAVVRNIAAIRSNALRRAAFDLAAVSGIAWASIGTLQAWRRKTGSHAGMRYEEVPDFASWAESVWNACGSCFAMIALRDGRNLDALYPKSMPRISRLKVFSGSALVGWAVVRNTQMKAHRQFGDLHVGTLVDCLSLPEHAPLVAEAAERFLEARGVDIIVSNQCCGLWREALADRGYLPGPSNFAVAVSRQLAKLLDPFDRNVSAVHLTRGDGDGPIHL